MRWIRLDVSFDDSPWLFALSAESQLAWIKLLCHMKRDGLRGSCKALRPLVASRRWGVGEESVVKMLAAAVEDGAIKSDGVEWSISHWEKYQEPDKTAVERMRRHRANLRYGVTTVTDRNLRCNPSRDIDIDIDKEKNTTCSERKSPDASHRPERPTPEEAAAYFQEKGSSQAEAERFWLFYDSKGWKVGKNPMLKWRSAASGWISRNKPEPGTAQPSGTNVRYLNPEEVDFSI